MNNPHITAIEEAILALLADIEDYERINKLSPNPGKKDCWQSVTRMKEALTSIQELKAERAAISHDDVVKFAEKYWQRIYDQCAKANGAFGLDLFLQAITETLEYSAAIKAERTWMPIESAPKDGTRILIWIEHEPKLGHLPEYSHAAIGAWTNHNKGGWTWMGILGNVTHWQPLPSPPVAPGGGE